MREFTRVFVRKCWRYLPSGIFVAAVLCACFAYGVAVGKWHLFPHKFLNAGIDSLMRIADTTSGYRFHPARYEGEGVVKHERQQVSPGVTLISGLWKRDDGDWKLGVRLIDIDGNLIHHWWADPRDIWTESPHNDVHSGSRDRWFKYPCIDGVVLLPGGDIILNLNYLGLVRINAQSEVVWKIIHRTHHSIFQDADGNLWVCGARWREDDVVDFPGLRLPYCEDLILKVTEDGVIEREISVLRTIYESEYYNLIFAGGSTAGDILHMNDVEVLSEQKADAFDLFQAGDIMVSLRFPYAVLVIDGETDRIKWCMTHRFIDQHDPDFTDDGYITVFDNHLDYLGGSRILRIEPSTMKVDVQHGHREGQHFFTLRCGKHQHLPNGNMLITEAQAGRLFEIDRSGKVVWSWIASRRNNMVPEILDGIRYSAEYADFSGSPAGNEE